VWSRCGYTDCPFKETLVSAQVQEERHCSAAPRQVLCLARDLRRLALAENVKNSAQARIQSFTTYATLLVTFLFGLRKIQIKWACASFSGFDVSPVPTALFYLTPPPLLLVWCRLELRPPAGLRRQHVQHRGLPLQEDLAAETTLRGDQLTLPACIPQGPQASKTYTCNSNFDTGGERARPKIVA
jgi:hypothetical protein